MLTLVENLKIGAVKAGAEADTKLGGELAARLGVAATAVRDYRIMARSVDSRRGEPLLVYRVVAEIDDAAAAKRRLPSLDAAALAALAPAQLELPEHSGLMHPLVVGTGPAGIFAALALALARTAPIVLDRGPMVEARRAGQKKFLADRELDPENNLLIGEGGAGAFSDGKLYTGTRDVRGRFVLEALAQAGAPDEIVYANRPHIGSDNLAVTTENLRRRIEAAGGTFKFNTEVADVAVRSGRCAGVKLASGEVIEAPAVLIAPGLGGRDLVRTLAGHVDFELKPFQIGCRIEHPQEFIDRLQYHGSRPAALGAAEYHLVSHPRGAFSGISSFCMCPGGEIVNASAWRGGSATNGMSCYARAGKYANGCLIATFPPDRFASLAEVDALIHRLETELFRMGGSDYTFPAQDAAAFLAGRDGLRMRGTSSQTGLVPGRIDALLPEELTYALRGALRDFDRRCPGFIGNGKFVGVESCVSSPLRFTRIQPRGGVSSLPGLWLAGEGAGAAGGIVSAACDGLRCAENMLKVI